MKTIVQNSTNYSKIIFEDDVSVTMQSDKTIVGDPVELIILDLHSGNATLYENVTVPDDWTNIKYTFDGTTFTTRSDWVDT